MEINLTPQEIEKYLEKHGKKGERVVSFLGKNMMYINDLNAPLTAKVMDMLIRDHEFLIERLASLQATDEEKVRYRVVRDILTKISDIIESYKRELEEIRKGSTAQ